MFEKEMTVLKELHRKGCFAVPMYAGKIQDAHCFDSYEEFIKIPFSYKEDIRNSSVFARTTTAKEDVYGIFSSSGTTGDKTYYVFSKKDKAVHEEFVRTFYNELGLSSADLGGVFAPVDTGVMAHTMMWQFTTMGAGYVNCPEPSPENMAALVSDVPVTVVATRPDIASSVAYFPHTAAAAKKSSVKKLILGGGFLSEGRRKVIEQTWDAACYNMFGMSEVFGPIAGECRQKNGQHYPYNNIKVALVAPTTMLPAKPGEPGNAVYTTLWDKGFPLLRYWSDDVLSITYEKCACGSLLPRFYHHGRMADCITVKGKPVFAIMVEEILFRHGYILGYCVRQQAERIVLQVEHPENSRVDAALRAELTELLGDELEIVIAAPGSLSGPDHGKKHMFVE